MPTPLGWAIIPAVVGADGFVLLVQVKCGCIESIYIGYTEKSLPL